jgi:hypothetical protein
MNLLMNFDFYKQPITLPIETKSKYSTKVGLIVSLITIIFFALHFYIESYEVIERKHPTILSLKQDTNSYNTSLEVSNKTINFFITIQKDFETEKNFLDYFEITSQFSTVGNNEIMPLKFSNCTEDDFERLRKLGYDYVLDPSEIVLCPRINFAFSIYEKYSYKFSYGAIECSNPAKGCIRDEDMYEKLSNGAYNLKTSLTFIDNTLNLLDYSKPLSHRVSTFSRF